MRIGDYWPFIAAAAVIVFMVFADRCHGKGVDQVDRWNRAEIRKIDILRTDKAVALYQRLAARYNAVNSFASSHRASLNTAPAPVLFCLHYRESDNNFRCHAHEGSPLNHRTRDEPKGRLPNKKPPYTFEESAEDAYYVCDKLQLTDWNDVQSSFDRMERFNGYGYRNKGINAPYICAGTNLYGRGKFIADHRFSRTAIDKQLGCIAILKRMRDRGIALPFK